jgi:small Trp-rich protein
MLFLVVGVVLLVLKWAELGPVAQWDWWWVLSPFALAAIWWWIADATGYTRRKAEQRDEDRKLDRLNKSRRALGLPSQEKKR